MTLRRDGFADEGLFGGGETGRIFAQAGRADADVFDVAVVHAGEGCDSHLGDGLRIARADLADVGFVTIIGYVRL